MLRIRQFYTLAVLTAVEAIRQPICLLLTTACVFLTALTPVLLLHNFGEDGKLARDSGLALHFVFGIFIACYTASSCLGKEMRTGTASAVLSKPISREIFFLAKFAGTSAVVVIFSVCASIATLLSERISLKFVMNAEKVGFITDWHLGFSLLAAPLAAFAGAGLMNYYKKRPFESMAFSFLLLALVLVILGCGFFDRSGAFKPYDLRIHTGILPVSIMITLGLMIISSIAITLSSRISIVPNMLICSMIFLLGMMSDYLFGAKAQESDIFFVVHRLIPDWQNFWKVDALSDGGSVPWSYVLKTSIYAISYAAGVIFLGLVSFSAREMD